MCPWNSALGAEFDLLVEGEVLVKLARENQLSLAHSKLPCQTMTWARSPLVRSWDSSWGKSGLSELPLERVQVGNLLLMFTMQLCISPSGTLSRVGRGLLLWLHLYTHCQVWP